MTEVPRAVWLDRDGTLNVKAPAGQYVIDPAQLRLLPGAGEAVARLNRASVPVAVVTNQRGIALGQMTEANLVAVHERLKDLLSTCGAHLDAILHCPHATGACHCRKPGPGLLHRAAALLDVSEMSATVMIGDSESDVEAGRAAGTRTIRLAQADVRTTAGKRCPSLAAAVEHLLAP